ncbi:unnamed protein product, partial [Ectocarpus sp. 13 AM-2016]
RHAAVPGVGVRVLRGFLSGFGVLFFSDEQQRCVRWWWRRRGRGVSCGESGRGASPTARRGGSRGGRRQGPKLHAGTHGRDHGPGGEPLRQVDRHRRSGCPTQGVCLERHNEADQNDGRRF